MIDEKYLNVVIDLSHWNAPPFFSTIIKDGIYGVIHKCSQGLDYLDKRYEERCNMARIQGLAWGAYHFGTAANPVQQADYFLDNAGLKPGELMALDWEA